MREWEELRLVEQLRSLRYLLPKTWLPQPVHEIDGNLLAELLRLPSGVEPLEWLKRNKRDLIGKVLLSTLLSRIQLLVQSRQVAPKAGGEFFSDKYGQWLGNVLQLTEVLDSFQEVVGTHPTEVSSRLLRTAFRELHSAYDGSRRRSPPSDEMWLFLEDLLQLPLGSDPVQHTIDRHNHLAAVQTLRHTLAQVQPPRHLLVGNTVTGQAERLLYPNTRQRARELVVELHELAIAKSSFALTLRTRVSERALLVAPDLPSRGIWWQGVERVTDNLGHHYLICYRPEESGNRLWWFDHSLQLICYPAIAPRAKEIVVDCNRVALVVVGAGEGEPMSKPKPVHQLDLGDLSWRVNISNYQ
jgi:hypothetical protein